MKYSILISVLLVCILSCKKKDSCKEELMVTKNLEIDYGCQNTKHTLNIDLNNEAKLIRSKETYDSEESGICHPEIDFSSYDLVIGKQTSGNLNDTILYDLRKTCPDNELTLTVDMIQSALTQPDNVTYHALIPKLGDEVILNIRINIR